MRVAVVIVNYRTPEMVLTCLNALGGERSAIPSLIAIVVDNASTDDSVAILSAQIGKGPLADWVCFQALPLNGGFGWGNNEAILALLASDAPPEAILLLNPDTIIQPGALVALVEDLKRRPDAGAVGSQLINEDGSLSGSSFRFPTIGREFMRGLGIGGIGPLLGIKPMLIPFGERGPIDWATGASVLIRTQALRDAGLFDTGFFLYFEEVELMYRFARHGWKSYHCPESRVIHIAGASTGVVDGQQKDSRPPPDYLFHSRHRYFALTGGRLISLLADLAWLMGDLCARLVAALSFRRSATNSQAERAALLRIGLGAKPDDAMPAVTGANDQPGHAPAWMKG